MNTTRTENIGKRQFQHPYPRYGLAAAVVNSDKKNWKEIVKSESDLVDVAKKSVQKGLNHFRVHTGDDRDDATELQFQYVSNDDLESSGQKADDGYFIAPHVVIDDRSARYLIKEARSFLEDVCGGMDMKKSTELKRSFSTFTTKLNEGTATRSNPKTTKREAAFSLVASLTPLKPAAQVDFTNQVMIPDLELEQLIQFVRLFRKMQGSEQANPLTLKRKVDSNRRRPPLFDGNYPNAPRSSLFGPVGLIGAMGEWARRGEILKETQKKVKETLHDISGNPFYLVSYDGNLMRQEYIGHHVARLARNHDLPRVIESLYRIRFYNQEDNAPDSQNRQLFFRMAGRFLQSYTGPAFRDFLSFRVQYDPVLLPIFTDFFMEEYNIDEDIVQSARAYGSYLNDVAYHVAREEVKGNEDQPGGGTGRSIYEAKARALAQFESTAMSVRRPSALFAQLNVMSGRQSHRDVPAEAELFIEAVNTGEVSFDQAKDLVLAFMRLRSGENTDNTETEEFEYVE
jgi:hypothetical protein